MSDVARRVTGIARAARTLDELLGSGAAGASAPSPEALAAASEIVDRWRFSVARGDREVFRRRVAWDGLREDELVRRIAAGLETREPPALSERLGTLLEALASGPPGDRADAVATPFGDLWRPAASDARRRLEALAGVGEQLAPGALDDLEDHLVRQLSRVSTEALWERFAARSVTEEPASEGSHRVYDAFVAGLCDGGLLDVFEAYPVVARQVARLVDTWEEATVELCRRLAAVRARVEAELAQGRPVGRVVAIQSGLSDRHRGGRRVQALDLESGLRLVYKPRDVEVEAAFQRLLEVLADAGLEEAPPALRVVAEEGYGFFEYVEPGEPEDMAAVHRWFRRAGALACLTSLLRAVDLHMDNVIATAAGPVLVDAESLLQPDRPPREATVPQPDPECVTHSALTSFMTVGPRGAVAEVSGLCGRGGHLAAASERVWQDLGSDRMAATSRDRLAAPERNVVRVNGELQPAERFAEDIAAGFAATHRFLRRHRGELLAPGGPLAVLGDVRVRILLRDSNQYASVMAATMTPRFQRQGWATGVLADSLNRGAVVGSEPPPEWPVAAAERRALDGLDIPLLQVAGNGADLEGDVGVTVTGLFPRPAVEQVAERLRRLDERDLERRLDSLGWLLPGAVISEAALASPLVRTAEVIGRRVLERAVAPDGTLRRPTTGNDGERDPLVEVSLYDGACGVAAFLATLAAITDEPSFAVSARAMARPVSAWLESSRASGDGVLVGACHGLGGIAWAGAIVARLLGDDWWLELANAAAGGIVPERIAADERLDVEGGVAGAILGLLALHQVTDESWLLERAVLCGQRLLAAATPASTGGAAWVGSDGAMRAGFAHGAAGIAASLARLAGATGFAPFDEAVRDGLDFERGLYDPEARNWPVVVGEPGGGERRLLMTAWCHGAPGVLLGRLVVRDRLGGDAVGADLEAALATTQTAGVGRSDHLCCGTMGRVDALMTTGLRLGSAELARAAATRAVVMVRRAVCDRGFRFNPADDGVEPYAPGLFRGEAGVGYQLLRLAHPGRVASVLAFEGPTSEGTSGGTECGGRTP